MHIDAVRGCVAQEYLIEGWSPDLVGVGIAGVGLGEVPGPGLRVASPRPFVAPYLGRKARIFDFVNDARGFPRMGIEAGSSDSPSVLAGEDFALERG